MVTFDPAHAGPDGVLHDAALLAVDGRVAWTGPTAAAPHQDADEVLDVDGAAVIPGFVDAHTHLVFAGDRAAEFEARMEGRPYTAGGIRSTVAATRAATDEELRRRLGRFVAELHAQGTTTFEVKSGYGLTVEDEERLLRLAGEVTAETTFLGAHVVPPEFADEPEAYVDLVVGPMLDACAPHARWIDVFCERGAFSVEQSRRILTAGAARGLGVRVHASQLGPGEGVALAVELDAASVDHCTYLTDDDVERLAASNTVAGLLPGVEFSTRHPYPSGRRLLDAGATIALASDCNPGSSFTSSMPFCVALAVREMGLTPMEALRAATLGGAAALRRDDVGHLRPGARADLVVLDAPSHIHLAYRPGVPLVARTLRSAA
nr:imidazolonepropionase [Leifsonia sp. C5G2]